MSKIVSSLMIACLCFFVGTVHAQDINVAEEAQKTFQALNLNVDGMTCQGCEHKVKSALTNMDGVVAVGKVCSQGDKAVLTYDPTVTNEGEIMAKLADATGYGISVSEDAAKAADAETKKATCTKSKTECTKAQKAACTKSKKECAKSKAACTKSSSKE